MSNGNWSSAPLEVYEAYQESILAGSEDWKQFISETVKFSSPLLELAGKKSFIKFHELRFKALQKKVLEKIAVCDNYVITVSAITFKAPNQQIFKVKATEWYTIHNGQIEGLESFGDTSILKNNPINIFSYLKKSPQLDD